jgi:hypothetical protein
MEDAVLLPPEALALAAAEGGPSYRRPARTDFRRLKGPSIGPAVDRWPSARWEARRSAPAVVRHSGRSACRGPRFDRSAQGCEDGEAGTNACPARFETGRAPRPTVTQA